MFTKITGEATRFPPNYCATTNDTSHHLAKTPESISMNRGKEPVCVVVWTTAWERFGNDVKKTEELVWVNESLRFVCKQF